MANTNKIKYITILIDTKNTIVPKSVFFYCFSNIFPKDKCQPKRLNRFSNVHWTPIYLMLLMKGVSKLEYQNVVFIRDLGRKRWQKIENMNLLLFIFKQYWPTTNKKQKNKPLLTIKAIKQLCKAFHTKYNIIYKQS